MNDFEWFGKSLLWNIPNSNFIVNYYMSDYCKSKHQIFNLETSLSFHLADLVRVLWSCVTLFIKKSIPLLLLYFFPFACSSYWEIYYLPVRHISFTFFSLSTKCICLKNSLWFFPLRLLFLFKKKSGGSFSRMEKLYIALFLVDNRRFVLWFTSEVISQDTLWLLILSVISVSHAIFNLT